MSKLESHLLKQEIDYKYDWYKEPFQIKFISKINTNIHTLLGVGLHHTLPIHIWKSLLQDAQNVTLYEDKVFKEVIKVKWGNYNEL